MKYRGFRPIVDVPKGASIVSLQLNRSATLACLTRHMLSGGLTGLIREGQSANLRMSAYKV